MKNCYLCGKEATTFDHIPPKGLFPKNFQYKGIKVPSCKTCNNESSKDDEYLRDCFTISGHNKAARQVFLDTVRRSYLRPYSQLQTVTPKTHQSEEALLYPKMNFSNQLFYSPSFLHPWMESIRTYYSQI